MLDRKFGDDGFQRKELLITSEALTLSQLLLVAVRTGEHHTSLITLGAAVRTLHLVELEDLQLVAIAGV